MTEKIIIKRLADLPPRPMTMGGMEWNQTGTWRYLTPTVKDKMPPCRNACPAGNPVPQFIDSVKQGNEKEALALLLDRNPLPGITGRLCYHPCQTGCIRRELDRTIPIQDLEQYISDHAAFPKLRRAVKKKEKVAVIGAGPLGLTCAYFLGREGYGVTLVDPLDRAGGFLLDVPGDRLPPQALDREVGRVIELSGMSVAAGEGFDEKEVKKLSAAHQLVVADPWSHKSGGSACEAIMSAWVEGDWPGKAEKLLLPETEADFAGYKPSHVAHAVGQGRMLAASACERLSGKRPGDWDADLDGEQVITKEDIKLDCFSPARPKKASKKGAGLNRPRARAEAERCLSCGTCNHCLICVRFCPDISIHLDSATGLITVDLDHCKGCGICAYECPRHVITMENEL